MLEQRALLNAQTGEYLPIEVEYVGEESLDLDGKTVRAIRYQLRNTDEEIDITVWYESVSKRWLSLESRVGGDRVIRYLPSSIETLAASSASTGFAQQVDNGR